MINCKEIAEIIQNDLKKEYERINKIKKPKLVIIDVLNTLESNSYIKNKIKLAKLFSIDVALINQIDNQKHLIQIIKNLNEDNNVDGYIIQFPLPKEYNKYEIIKHIDYTKDVDGISLINLGSTFLKHENFSLEPCTCEAIFDVINYLKIDLNHKNVVIINRSLIIGKPLVNKFLNANSTVSICHSFTNSLRNYTKKADIIISAVGKYNLLKCKDIKKNTIILDVGFNLINNKIKGDIDYLKLSKKTKNITTVPGGIGILTVVNVYKNLLKIIKHKYKIN